MLLWIFLNKYDNEINWDKLKEQFPKSRLSQDGKKVSKTLECILFKFFDDTRTLKE